MWPLRSTVAAAGATAGAAVVGGPLPAIDRLGWVFVFVDVRVLGIDAQFAGAFDAGEVTVINGGVAKYLTCIEIQQPALPGGEGDGSADGD